MLVSACLVLSSCQTGRVNDQDTEAAKLGRLRQEYERYDRAVSYLLAVNAEAMRQNPDLRLVERGLHRINEMKKARLPGEREFKQYRASHANPQEFDKTYSRCRHAFGTEVWAEALMDPDREQELRPIMIFNYRHLLPRSSASWRQKFIDTLRKRGLTVFEPDDTNDERLWRNITRNVFEIANYTAGERAKLIEEGAPEFMRKYAGWHDFTTAYSELCSYWMKAYVPRELIQAAKELHEQQQKLSAIEPGWAKPERFGANSQEEYRKLYIANSLCSVLQDRFPDLNGRSFEGQDPAIPDNNARSSLIERGR
jgi:hypothetical protein